MPIAAAIAVPLFVFLMPVLLVLTHVAPQWFGRDEIWLIQQPGMLLLPFSTAIWWIAIRRIVFHRPGGFVMPWVVFLLTCGALAWHWGLL